MEVTFIANARVAGYRAGQVYKVDSKELTPMHRALLAKGRHLALLDPLSLDEDTLKEPVKDDGGKSTDKPSSSREASRSSNGEATASDGGKRPENSEGDSTAE